MLAPMTRRQKRIFLLLLDCMLLLVSLYCAFAFRYGTGLPIGKLMVSWPIIAIVLAAAPIVIIGFRLPWIKLSTLDTGGALRVAGAGLAFGLLASLTSAVLDVGSSRSIPGILAVSFFSLSLMARVLAVQVMQRDGTAAQTKPVAIFGAGAAGIQLSSALSQSCEVNPVCFVDDDPSFVGLLIAGLRVVSRTELKEMVKRGQVERTLIAIPSLSQTELGKLVSDLSQTGSEIQVLPSFVDLISGKSKVPQLVSPDALLGRNKVDLNVPEIMGGYAGKTVMVTGAGGSIGSELCRQLLECRPSRIVLFEQSEFALYTIDASLRPLAEMQDIELDLRLGSVCDQARVEDTIQAAGVQIVLHAAAYKHVPLVECNEVEGARNNVIGTKTVAEACDRLVVERFILVSTDKAVRPTNIMGATKRLAELVVQDLALRSKGTRFSMVRFGNVLGSSGSVLPLFQKQIRNGGPVTVTHPEVTRFFMTIPEASRLVLLAGAFAEGGEVFVLKMGEPMKIIDIARRMIEMAGGHVKSDRSPDGIEIKVTGLRPGEKLYEELLIDDDSLVSTPHEKILRAQEQQLSEAATKRTLVALQDCISKSDSVGVRKIIKARVQGYREYEQDLQDQNVYRFVPSIKGTMSGDRLNKADLAGWKTSRSG